MKHHDQEIDSISLPDYLIHMSRHDHIAIAYCSYSQLVGTYISNQLYVITIKGRRSNIRHFHTYTYTNGGGSTHHITYIAIYITLDQPRACNVGLSYEHSKLHTNLASHLSSQCLHGTCTCFHVKLYRELSELVHVLPGLVGSSSP